MVVVSSKVVLSRLNRAEHPSPDEVGSLAGGMRKSVAGDIDL